MNSEAETNHPQNPDAAGGKANSGSLICLGLALLTLLVYLPVRGHGFVSYDDPIYVTGNRHVQAGLTGAGLHWAFTTFAAGNWHPLTWLSLMLDRQLFGPSPAGPHLVNVLFHVANAVLLFVLLRGSTGVRWPAALAAALFALHPLHVESVAWVAERKDVLSAFFFLLSLLAYRSYVTHGSESGTGYYLTGLLCFALGLMSKPMLVTLPLVLLLLDYWPLQRFSAATLQRLLLEKLPFFALSAVSCVVTFAAQKQGGAVRSLSSFSVNERLANAVVAYARYLGKTFWPVNLAVPYPHPGHWPAGAVAGATILMVGLSAVALWSGRRFRFALTGWFWFVGMLIPTIGLIQVSNQAMADRYSYLPLIGVFIVIAWGAAEAVRHWRLPKPAVAMAAGLAVAACAAQTEGQLSYWHDTGSLFRHTLAVTKGNALAHNNLGNVLLDNQQADEAVAQFKQALAIQPDYADAHVNLGNARLQQGRVDEAMAEFQLALNLQPDSAEAHYNLGNALLQKGRPDEAILHFRRAVALNPEQVLAENNLANTLLQAGQLDEAIRDYQAVLKIRPDFVAAHHNLAMALRRKGRMDEAVAHFRKVVELQPDNANARNNLGWMLRQTGQLDEAAAQLQKALELRPDYPEAQGNLAKTLTLKGQAREAEAHYRTALRLRPDDPQNLSELAWLLATWPDAAVRNGADALALAQKAVQLTSGQDPVMLRTLAAANAETGRFPEAAATARRALQLSQSDPALGDSLQTELKLYETGSPVRDGKPE